MFNRICTLILTALIIMSLFTSCNKQKDLLHEENDSDITNCTDLSSEFTLNQEKIFDSNKIECETLVDSYKNGFIFTGSKYNIDDNFSMLSKNVENPDQEIMNSDIRIDQTDIVIKWMKKYNDEIYIISQNNIIFYINVLDQNGNEKRKIELDYYPNDIQINNDIYILDSVNNKINCYTPDLELITSYDIKTEYDNEQLCADKICVSGQNEIYCLLRSRVTDEHKIVSVSETTKVICNSVNDMESVNNIWVNSSGNIIISGISAGIYTFDEIDRDGNITNMYEIDDCDSVYGLTSSDHLIYSNNRGLYDYFGDEKSLLIPSEQYSNKEVFSVSIESNEISVYMNNSVGFSKGIYEVDQNNEIISEYKNENVTDCFISDDKIYYVEETNDKFQINIISDGSIINTGICYDDSELDVCKIGVLENGCIIVSTMSEMKNENTINVYNENYECIKNYTIKDPVLDFIKGNKKLYTVDCNNIYEINEKYELEKTNIKLKIFGLNPVFCSSNNVYDFVFCNDKGLYGYKINENSCELLLNFSKNGVRDVSSALLLADDKIVLTSIMNAYLAQKVETDEYSTNTKKIITLDYLEDLSEGTESVLFNTVSSFNNNSKEYIIELNKYTSNNDETASDIFERDIISGKIPDIIILSPFMNVNTYLKDNLLTDMNTLIEKDPQISRNMFNTNILDAFLYDKKLYCMPMSYELHSIVLNDKYNYNNFDELIDLIRSKVDEGKSCFDIATMQNNIRVYINEKIDKNNKKLSISEDDMNRLVSFYKDYCQNAYGGDDRTQFMIRGTFGEPLSYYNTVNIFNGQQTTGYPGISGVVNPLLAMSVTEQSSNKEASWEFIKQFFDKTDAINMRDGYSLVSILKENSVKPDTSVIPQNYIDDYNRIINGKFLSYYEYDDLVSIIFDELVIEDDLTVEEKSKVILNKLEKYYAESR